MIFPLLMIDHGVEEVGELDLMYEFQERDDVAARYGRPSFEIHTEMSPNRFEVRDRPIKKHLKITREEERLYDLVLKQTHSLRQQDRACTTSTVHSIHPK